MGLVLAIRVVSIIAGGILGWMLFSVLGGFLIGTVCLLFFEFLKDLPPAWDMAFNAAWWLSAVLGAIVGGLWAADACDRAGIRKSPKAE